MLRWVTRSLLGAILLVVPLLVACGGGGGGTGEQGNSQQPAAMPDDGAVGDDFAVDFSLNKMMLIPAGAFTMGSRPGVGHDDERPQRRIYLAAYKIGTYEVTNIEYAAFLNARRPSSEELASWVYFDDGTYQKIQNNSGAYSVVKDWELNPVVYVSWYGANAYATSFGMYLPTEAQWEKAGRGPRDDRLYPWGDDTPTPFVSLFNVILRMNLGSPGHFTSPVGSVPAGASPYGLMDMSGNVWEWCRDGYQSDWYSVMPGSDPSNTTEVTHRVLRGGSWANDTADFYRVSYRGHDAPNVFQSTFGFRCAAPPTWRAERAPGGLGTAPPMARIEAWRPGRGRGDRAGADN